MRSRLKPIIPKPAIRAGRVGCGEAFIDVACGGESVKLRFKDIHGGEVMASGLAKRSGAKYLDTMMFKVAVIITEIKP